MMYAITGITGKVGGELARTLIAAGEPVRAIIRDPKKGEEWAAQPRESWAEVFRSQGMKNPEPRMRMLDGFNQGWIEFKNGGSKAIKAPTNAVDVIVSLIANTRT